MRLRGFFAIVVGLGGVAVSAVGMRSGHAQDGVIGASVAFVAVLLGLGATARRRKPDENGEASADALVTVEAINDDQNVDLVEVAAEAAADPITDPLTGLMNEIFFSGLLSTKVATARRRLWPLSIVLLKLVMKPGVTTEAADAAIVAFVGVISETIRTADVACRVGARSFALLLDDTDEDGAAWVAERIQIAHAREGDSPIAKVCAGVASYPSHGIEPAEILITAKSALKQASDNLELPGLGRVIVAPQRPI
ncbi:GGDEF domain-containing protein [Ferrimicrobium acidiphilum]|jgi:diguanylate cyclase (GGDEF)-like protein|uniref:Putative diguanylate cyclase YcdT n=1 Tax=Ferrimicrobium acidiphilum DSM 19497 TaxID=1121877 RepID=A0A0D8FUG7_9ACTN|nr:GGDEF domain-containing protein [Ferrimicrobium acidiphilum]KJE76928.1 putative diguanylate cyclase YcdT [Ferrimicrobium acidiphilum DSM 19497]MCL5053988.1 GGDEF domain-containing protein [Gammaproteobacteria bacterium]